MNLTCTTESLPQRTTSRCPVCHASVPAEVWKLSDDKGAQLSDATTACLG